MVFLYIPNIIGYLRFVALFASFFTYQDNPILTVILYGTSQALDAFDGMAARKFNQCSRFGAVLDMVCDRASNGVFLAILAAKIPQYSWIFLSDIALDLVSHWYQMYVSLLKGAHHKKSKSKYALLNLYYDSKFVLFTLVLGNEMFLLSAYLIACGDMIFLPSFGVYFINICFAIGVILFAIKKLMSIIQLISASEMLVEMELEEQKEQAGKTSDSEKEKIKEK